MNPSDWFADAFEAMIDDIKAVQERIIAQAEGRGSIAPAASLTPHEEMEAEGAAERAQLSWLMKYSADHPRDEEPTTPEPDHGIDR